MEREKAKEQRKAGKAKERRKAGKAKVVVSHGIEYWGLVAAR